LWSSHAGIFDAKMIFMAISKNPTTLTPAERVDYSKYYDLLVKRRAELLNLAQRDRQELKDQQGASGTPGDMADTSVTDTNTDYFLALADRERSEIIEIRDALERLHKGTYGLCENCNELIRAERLSKIPHARLCTDCKKDIEAHERVHHPHSTPKL
jgi:DnaK suppressor protein